MNMANIILSIATAGMFVTSVLMYRIVNRNTKKEEKQYTDKEDKEHFDRLAALETAFRSCRSDRELATEIRFGTMQEDINLVKGMRNTDVKVLTQGFADMKELTNTRFDNFDDKFIDLKAMIVKHIEEKN